MGAAASASAGRQHPGARTETSSQGADEGSGPASSTRQQMGSALVKLIDWADSHRRELALGSLLVMAGGSALLIRMSGGIPGYRRYTSAQQVASRLVVARLGVLRLPVLVEDATVIQGGLLRLSCVHYPALLRWQHRRHGVPPRVFAHRAAQAGEAVQVHLAGVRDATEAAQAFALQHLPSSRVHKLSILAATDLETLHDIQQAEGGVAWLAARRPAGLLPWAGGAWLAPEQHTGSRGEAGSDGVDPTELAAQRALEVGTSSADGDGNSHPGGSENSNHLTTADYDTRCSSSQPLAPEPVLWGELHAAGLPPVPCSGWLAALGLSPPPWRRVGRQALGEQLLARGLARLAFLEDMEYLGVPGRRMDAYAGSAIEAAQAGVGVYKQQVQPPLTWRQMLTHRASRVMPGSWVTGSGSSWRQQLRSRAQQLQQTASQQAGALQDSVRSLGPAAARKARAVLPLAHHVRTKLPAAADAGRATYTPKQYSSGWWQRLPTYRPGWWIKVQAAGSTVLERGRRWRQRRSSSKFD